MAGLPFYDHELTEIKNLDEVVSHSGAAPENAGGRRSQPRQGLAISIVQKHLGVKPDMIGDQSGCQQGQSAAPRGLIELVSDENMKTKIKNFALGQGRGNAGFAGIENCQSHRSPQTANILPRTLTIIAGATKEASRGPITDEARP